MMRFVVYLLVFKSLSLSLLSCSARHENDLYGHDETAASKQADSIYAYLLLTSSMLQKDMDSESNQLRI